MGTFHWTQNYKKLQNGDKWWENLLWKSTWILLKFWKVKHPCKTSVEKLNGRDIPSKHFYLKILLYLITSKGCPLYCKFQKMIFHSPLEISRTENWNFWFNGWHPVFFFTLENKVTDNLIFRQEPSNIGKVLNLHRRCIWFSNATTCHSTWAFLGSAGTMM